MSIIAVAYCVVRNSKQNDSRIPLNSVIGVNKHDLGHIK